MTDLISVEKIAQWQKLKGMVLDSVSSPITKRVYNMALDEFMAWFQQEPRPGFTKATVSAWRVSPRRAPLGLVVDHYSHVRDPQAGRRGGRQRAARTGIGCGNQPRQE